MKFFNSSKRKFSCLIAVMIWIAAVSVFADDQAEWQGANTGVAYWLAKQLVIDLDEDLKEMGLEPEVCTYQNTMTKKQISFKGLGPCLYLNFKQSMGNDQIPGTTYFWIKGSSADAMPFQIRWRPPIGGLTKLLKQVYELKLEKPLYWIRNHLNNKKSAEEIHYKEFLIGEWDLILPEDQKFIESLSGNINPFLANKFKDISRLKLKLKPSERENGLVVHEGYLIAELRHQTVDQTFDQTFDRTGDRTGDQNSVQTQNQVEGQTDIKSVIPSEIQPDFQTENKTENQTENQSEDSAGNSVQKLVFRIKTNMNILKRDRKFYLDLNGNFGTEK